MWYDIMDIIIILMKMQVLLKYIFMHNEIIILEIHIDKKILESNSKKLKNKK